VDDARIIHPYTAEGFSWSAHGSSSENVGACLQAIREIHALANLPYRP
jgi:hypothetical protein